ncbi:MAG TPA: hypothetical protein VNZ64_02335 [Candidatus Acidoferrum sp.]|nr:hypothetical protein [Candidatus Acidoferrum sp.]
MREVKGRFDLVGDGMHRLGVRWCKGSGGTLEWLAGRSRLFWSGPDRPIGGFVGRGLWRYEGWRIRAVLLWLHLGRGDSRGGGGQPG